MSDLQDLLYIALALVASYGLLVAAQEALEWWRRR